MSYDLYLEFKGETALVSADLNGQGPDINVRISDAAGSLHVILTPAQADTLCAQIQTAEPRAEQVAAEVRRVIDGQ